MKASKLSKNKPEVSLGEEDAQREYRTPEKQKFLDCKFKPTG